ncbi:MAG: hypothetical protein ACJA19_000996 [Bacteroidia bacterium]|jgi:hypothetical protein
MATLIAFKDKWCGCRLYIAVSQMFARIFKYVRFKKPLAFISEDCFTFLLWCR